jgi:hypothetical protein
MIHFVLTEGRRPFVVAAVIALKVVGMLPGVLQ